MFSIMGRGGIAVGWILLESALGDAAGSPLRLLKDGLCWIAREFCTAKCSDSS